MKNYTLNNGVEMPVIGLGVWQIKDQKEAIQAVETGLQIGYRHIDTAMIYHNEAAVGQAIRNSGIDRSQLFITTKLWNDDQRSGKVEEAFQASLDRLGLDYIDLYLVHWPVKETYVKVWEKMEAIYQSGKARAIGVCNYNPHHLDDLLQTASVVPAVNQIECHPYLTQESVIKYCKSKNIQPEAWSPLGSGKTQLLSDPVIVAIAKAHAKTPAQIVLRWHLEQGIDVIPKSTHKDRQAENLNILDFHLTADEVNQISALNKNQRTGPDPEHVDF